MPKIMVENLAPMATASSAPKTVLTSGCDEVQRVRLLERGETT